MDEIDCLIITLNYNLQVSKQANCCYYYYYLQPHDVRNILIKISINFFHSLFLSLLPLNLFHFFQHDFNCENKLIIIIIGTYN